MMRKLILGWLLIYSCSLPLSARTWTDSSGNSRVEAELVAVKDSRAFLERADGRVVGVPLERLSPDDIKYLASLPEHKAAVTPFLTDAKAEPTATTAPVPKIKVDDESKSGEVRRFTSPSWGFKALAFSPDGEMLAAAHSGQALTLFDLDTTNVLSSHERLRQLTTINQVAFSPSGDRVVIAGYNGMVQVWKVDDAKRLVPENEFKPHNATIESLNISPDGKFVLSGDQRRGVRYWNLTNGQEVYGWEGFRSGVKATFISKRGTQGLASDGQTVALLDLRDGKILQTMQLGRGTGQCVAISPDGSHIAVNDTYAMRVWETKTGKQLPVFQDSEIQWATVFSPDGRYLVSSGNAKVNVWSIDKQQRAHLFTAGDSGYVQSLAYSPDGTHIAATAGPIGKLVQVFRLPPELRP